jgi:ABC-2 type transport system permease protein
LKTKDVACRWLPHLVFYMKKVLATIVKEWLLMRRDIAGLLLLMAMPTMLMIVMAVIQDQPFKDYQQMHFDLLVVSDDTGSVSRDIKASLSGSKSFVLHSTVDGRPIDGCLLKQLLQKGVYKAGLIIPKDATGEMVNAANKMANALATNMGLVAGLPVRPPRDSDRIQLYFDPATMPAFRTSVANALDRIISNTCSDMVIKRLSGLAGAKDADSNVAIDKYLQAVALKEMPVTKGLGDPYISSVQHNVPAWAIFGIFFIAIPITAHTIKERQEGSHLRILLIPNVSLQVIVGKVLFFTILCAIQFWFLCLLGIWLMPQFGLSSLLLGAHPWLLVPVSLATGFMATAYGYLLSVIFKSVNQGLPFSSISIVILSALGGIWIPAELLSGTLKKVAMLSPLHWSLDAFNQVTIRNAGWGGIASPLSLLLGTGLLLILTTRLVQALNRGA